MRSRRPSIFTKTKALVVLLSNKKDNRVHVLHFDMHVKRQKLKHIRPSNLGRFQDTQLRNLGFYSLCFRFARCHRHRTAGKEGANTVPKQKT